MILYDGTSNIAWKTGELTVEQMAEMPEFEQLLSRPSVLYDDGNGGVYSWRLLSSLCYEWGVEQTDDADADFSALVDAMKIPRPTIEEQVAEARQTAEDAKVTAEQAGTSTSVKAAASLYVNASSDLTSTDVANTLDLIEDFKQGGEYGKGMVRRYEGKYYRMAKDIDATTSQTYLPGPGMESLYTLIDLAPDGIRVWHQPTDATNSFALGEKCHYPDADGAIYVSKRDGNTSEPGTDEWWVPADEAEA